VEFDRRIGGGGGVLGSWILLSRKGARDPLADGITLAREEGYSHLCPWSE
jgi:hypothetical protein